MNMVSLCLNAGFNPFAIDILGRTALDLAKPFGNSDGLSMAQVIELAIE